VAKEILALRVQQATMHGYANYAEYATADTMAGKPAKVMELLEVSGAEVVACGSELRTGGVGCVVVAGA
jgi:Zn-dependent oligopeptidase